MAEGRQPRNEIRYARRLRMFKQKELAWILEVHPTKISKLENGTIVPDHQLLDRLSILLQVSPRDLYPDFHQANIQYVLERLKQFRAANNEKTKEEKS